jgi:hypothetical protein
MNREPVQKNLQRISHILCHASLVSITDTSAAALGLRFVFGIPTLSETSTSSSGSCHAVLDTFGGVTPDNIPFIR